MTTHSVLALLIVATLVVTLAPPTAMAQEKESRDFATLIRQLDTNKAAVRDEAKKKLIEAGVPAVGIVLKTLLDKESPRETQARCIAILRTWEKDGQEKMLAKLKEAFKDLNPPDYPHVQKSLAEIKRLCLRKFRFTQAQAVEHLESKGCRFARGNRSAARIFLNKWSGTLEDFQVIQLLKGRGFEIYDMRGELLPALKGLNVKTMRFARPKGSTGRNPVFYKMAQSDFEIIAGFTNLRELDFQYFEFENNSLEPLVKANTLKSLSLSGRSNDETVKIVSRIESLEAISLRAAKISNEAFSHIANLKNLSSLTLPRKVNDRMLETVGKLSKLRTLTSGYDQEITGSGFKHLKNCDQLRELHLPKGIDPDSLGFLASMKNLESLKLSGFTMNDSVMVHVAKAKQLRSLKLSETMVRGTTFSQLKTLQQLSFIHFDRNHFMSDVATEQLIKLPSLRRIYSEWTPFTDRSLELVLESESIESVEFSYGLLTQKGIEKFNSAKKKREHQERPKFVPESKEHVKALQNLLDKGAGMRPNIGFTAKDGTHKYLVQIHLIEGIWKGGEKDLESLKSIPHMALATNLKNAQQIVQFVNECHEQVYMIGVADGVFSDHQITEMQKLVGEKRVVVGTWDPKLGWQRKR